LVFTQYLDKNVCSSPFVYAAGKTEKYKKESAAKDAKEK